MTNSPTDLVKDIEARLELYALPCGPKIEDVEFLKKAADAIEELQAYATQWKANHADMVARNALFHQRPDLPVDRIPAHDELVRLQARVNELEGDLAWRSNMLRRIDTDHPDIMRNYIKGAIKHPKKALVEADYDPEDEADMTKTVSEYDDEVSPEQYAELNKVVPEEIRKRLVPRTADLCEDTEQEGVKKSVEVRAISLGYYGAQLREVGEKFDLLDGAHFSSSWMEKING